MRPGKEIVLTTCPRDCYDSCGIAVIKRDGQIRKVLGDPNHPVARGALCGKCALAYNGVHRDPNSRLQHPLKRTGPKGEGRFARVSWDEALTEIAERLRAIEKAKGAERIVHAHYTGTCSMIAGTFPVRFFNRLGALEVEPDSVCNMAGQVALDYTIGTAVEGFDPESAKDAHSIVVWGANPSASAPHAHKHWLPEAKAKKIVIDPVRHPTAAAADLHLQPFPGSDAALAFALVHVLKREGRIDRRFVRDHVVGWDEIEPLVEPCTPEWAEKTTGVPASQIVEAARLYGTGPSLLWLGQGLQRQPMGGNTFRACALLPAVTGYFGKPGGGLYYLNGGDMRGLDAGFLDASHLRKGPRLAFSQMELAERLEDPNRIAAFLCWNINPAASSPEQRRLRKALSREDLFTVVLDLFQTDTADHADIVLPAANFLEFDDLVRSYFHLTVGAQVKAQEPMGEALPNQEIFRRLAAKMGFNEPELYESDESMIERLLSGTAFKGGFAELKKIGTARLFDRPRIAFADFKFPTPSGKIELASARAEKDGLPRLPQPHVDPRPANGRFRLLSPASPWLMNDSYGNDAKIRAKLGPANVAIHPKDAARFKLKEGDRVRLENAQGALLFTLRVSDEIPEGTAFSPKGRWPKLDEQGFNINVLTPSRKSDMGESTTVHATEVAITKAA
ncbi:MAG TPA: molybdopterin-dependent oxidoreductase [Alphaproteobacteria bacterium]|nr:molybdopterin-dependent oxidoreductase [Alphaproteobacteria bacterium]